MMALKNFKIRINGPYYLNILFGCKESAKKKKKKKKGKLKPKKC
jgi:hypothetical protein